MNFSNRRIFVILNFQLQKPNQNLHKINIFENILK